MDGNSGGAENNLLLLITYTKIQGKFGNKGGFLLQAIKIRCVCRNFVSCGVMQAKRIYKVSWNWQEG